ncbi:1-phosphofructokinase family hexose kinase [Spiractinospora alimapuensis]|uniref:1-phosphofructokinase family hexose kinase n=1 Tax=Spiractinospora alimapuensis TaxID=2820884 RepID=UPI001F2D06B9|nr:1-phosphofructokinase family hexose kinase [Spiractinospora alimapuensis]QVQ50025.1 1-phosphofructokinase family hexose kinase [Spiractinospora alimapuensis]
MICTVTPNPSVDRTVEVSTLLRGEVLRAHGGGTDPGGKGVNVSRALHAQGVATVAVLPVGGHEGMVLRQLLAEHGVPATTVPVSGGTRGNITVVDEHETTTKINLDGVPLTGEESERLVTAVAERLDAGAEWLVIGGSLPSDAPPDLCARLVVAGRDRGVPVAVDTSGPALEAVAHAGGVDLLTPNLEELAELVGRELTTVGHVVDAAETVRGWGNTTVLTTLGAHGALLVNGEGTWWAGSPPVVARSTVGAGDCALAGYLAAGGAPAQERLRHAVAWGAAAVALPGSAVPRPGQPRPHHVQLTADPAPDHKIKGGEPQAHRPAPGGLR